MVFIPQVVSEATLGATVPPLASTSSTSLGAFSILKDPAVFVPIVCAIVVVVVITVVVAVVMVLRRKDTTSECRSQGVFGYFPSQFGGRLYPWQQNGRFNTDAPAKRYFISPALLQIEDFGDRKQRIERGTVCALKLIHNR
ncbi:hypothetical protein CEXT_664181 [Caerostris extrusa]|uniref:Uncharacterized protein n=1 Tax=Caerostris extrusa TaxID=172846 RepID=A0AAV4RLM5_CAEEX|nr:hypothetical protein CEXT_664181 [Caerostris extrusa]